MHHVLGKKGKYFGRADQILVTHRPSQDLFLYMTWTGKEQVYVDKADEIGAYKGQVAILRKDELVPEVLSRLTDVHYFDHYCIGIIK